MHANLKKCLNSPLWLSIFLTFLLGHIASASANLPDIGEPADRILSPTEETKLGSSFHRALHQQESILTDPEISSYIQSLGNRLSSGIGQQPFTFFVIKDTRINAFAVPGGYIGINAGLILATRNEGELAGVMAHEIAHVTQRHIARFYAGSGGVARWTQIGAVLAAIALASQGQGEGATAALYAGTAAGYQSLINHTRLHEQEADRIGIQYLAQAGFNPGDMAGFFDVMRNQNLEADNRFEILRTHPLSANRVAEAKARAAQIGIRPVPSSKRYHLMKARLIALLSRQQPLLRHYKKQPPSNNIDLYTHALLLTSANQYKAAKSTIDKASQQDPDNIHFQLARAQLFLAQKQYRAAAKLLRNLLQLYPKHLATSLYYAETLKRQNKHLENIEMLEQLQRNQPQPPAQVYFLLAESYAKTQQKALSLFNQGRHYFYTGNYRAAGLQLKAAEKENTLNEQQQKEIEALLKIIEDEKKKKS